MAETCDKKIFQGFGSRPSECGRAAAYLWRSTYTKETLHLCETCAAKVNTREGTLTPLRGTWTTETS